REPISPLNLEHGASSEKGPGDLLRKAIASAAQATTELGWTWYSDKLTCMQLVEHAIGANPRSTAISYMQFVGSEGKPIGISLKALSKSWDIQQHWDGPREEGLDGIRAKKGNWRWSKFCRLLDFALSGVQGSAAPLRLLAYSFFLPRSVVAELRQMVVDHIVAIGSDGKSELNKEADIFSWRLIREPDTDASQSSVYMTTIKGAYEKWVNKCADLCKTVEDKMVELESCEDYSNPVLMLRRWSSLYKKAGHVDFSRIVEEEAYLCGKLSETKGLKLDWSFRACLFELVLQSCPRAHNHDSGFGTLVNDVRNKSTSPQDVLSRLQTAAIQNKESSIDDYIGRVPQKAPSYTDGRRGPKRSRDQTMTDSQTKQLRQGKSQRYKESDIPKMRASDSFKISPAEVSLRKHRGECFNCKKHGHIARDCPELQNNKQQISNASSAYCLTDVGLHKSDD
ncbi:hypothetical protein FOL47_003178, partial [Perkinsus chesapeaki]